MNPFDQQIQGAQKRLRALHRQIEALSSEQTPLIAEVLEEVSIALEELSVTGEELAQQNEELIAARETIETERQRYQELFEFAPDGYLVTNPEGVIQKANRAAVDMLNRPLDLMLGKPLVVFVAEGDRQAFHERLSQLIKDGQGRVKNWRIRLQRKDDTPFHATFTVSTMHDSDGNLTGLRWSIRDITARAEAEEALRATTEHYRSLFNEASIGLYRTTPEGEILDVNRVIAQMLGCPDRQALLEANALDFYAEPEDRARYLAQLKTSDQADIELKSRRRDGQIIWVQDTGRAVRDDEGEILYFDGALQDITERKRTEEALRESEKRFRILFNNLEDGVFVHPILPDNQPGPFIQVNEAACEMLGYSREEFRNMTPWDLDEPDTSSEYIPEVMRRLQEKGHAVFEAIQIAKDGRKVPVEVNANILELQEVPHIVSVVRDITERKLAEEALQEYARTQALLYAVTAAVSSSLTPDEILSSALDEMLAATNADAGWVVMPDPTWAQPHVASSYGVPEPVVQEETARYIRTHHPHPSELTGDDILTELTMSAEPPYVPPSEVLTNLDLHHGLCVPLQARDKTLGVLHLAQRDPDPPIDIDRSLLMTLGHQVGLALYNAQLYQEARQVDRLRTVNEITTAVVSSLEMDDVLRRILDKTKRALNATEGSVLMNDPNTGELFFAMTLGNETQNLQGMRIEADQGIAGWVAKHGQAVLVNDVDRDERFYEGIDAATGFETRSVLCAPMEHRGESLGVLEFVNKRQGKFNDEDLKLLEAAASIAAVALKNARLYGNLKQLLREREETQAQLIHTEKMSALGRLTASIAHEINNPLQAVQGYLSLTEEKLNAPQRADALGRYLGIVSEEVERISDIVSRMREFYRPEREGFWAVDVDDVIKKVLMLTSKKLEHGDVIVERTTPEELPTIEANADQLKQVFLNLVLNAIDAMPEGGTLHIRTALEQEREQPMVRIDFVDTGVGMTQEVMNRVFEPFVTTKEDGTGLGMSISYSIVQAHNGEISVTSEKGVGTTFTVRLPVEQPPGDE